MYAQTEAEYENQWNSLQETYGLTHGSAMSYLKLDLLLIYKKKFVICWTDQKLHFDNHANSRGEGNNAALKRELETSVGDLKSVVDSLELLLIDPCHVYIGAIQVAKTRLPFRLRVPILRDLIAYATSSALHKVVKQYNLITLTEGPLPRCTNVFTTTLRLPCAHRIQNRIYDRAGGEVLKIEDVHPHWHFEGSAAMFPMPEPTLEATPEPSDVEMNDEDTSSPHLPGLANPLLQVQTPAIIRPKGRPVGAKGRRGVRRQQESEDFTQRDTSQYEHVLAAQQHEEQQQQWRRGRGRGSTRARGGQRGGVQRGGRAVTPPSIQWMEACLQRFIDSQRGAGTVGLQLFKTM